MIKRAGFTYITSSLSRFTNEISDFNYNLLNKTFTPINSYSQLYSALLANPGGYYEIMNHFDFGGSAIPYSLPLITGYIKGNFFQWKNYIIPNNSGPQSMIPLNSGIIDSVDIENGNLECPNAGSSIFVGQNNAFGLITRSRINGRVDLNAKGIHVGGLCNNNLGQIWNCFGTVAFLSTDPTSTGTVFGIQSGNGYTRQCISVPKYYIGWTRTGGLIDITSTSLTDCDDCYYDSSQGDSDTTLNVQPRNTQQLLYKSNYPTWDFLNIWNLREGFDYPSFFEKSIFQSVQYLKTEYNDINLVEPNIVNSQILDNNDQDTLSVGRGAVTLNKQNIECLRNKDGKLFIKGNSEELNQYYIDRSTGHLSFIVL